MGQVKADCSELAKVEILLLHSSGWADEDRSIQVPVGFVLRLEPRPYPRGVSSIALVLVGVVNSMARS
jgi:hypothetical protein